MHITSSSASPDIAAALARKREFAGVGLPVIQQRVQSLLTSYVAHFRQSMSGISMNAPDFERRVAQAAKKLSAEPLSSQPTPAQAEFGIRMTVVPEAVKVRVKDGKLFYAFDPKIVAQHIERIDLKPPPANPTFPDLLKGARDGTLGQEHKYSKLHGVALATLKYRVHPRKPLSEEKRAESIEVLDALIGLCNKDEKLGDAARQQYLRSLAELKTALSASESQFRR